MVAPTSQLDDRESSLACEQAILKRYQEQVAAGRSLDQSYWVIGVQYYRLMSRTVQPSVQLEYGEEARKAFEMYASVRELKFVPKYPSQTGQDGFMSDMWALGNMHLQAAIAIYSADSQSAASRPYFQAAIDTLAQVQEDWPEFWGVADTAWPLVVTPFSRPARSEKGASRARTQYEARL